MNKLCELCGKEEKILFQTETYCPDCESDETVVNEWNAVSRTKPGVGGAPKYPMDTWDPDKTPKKMDWGADIDDLFADISTDVKTRTTTFLKRDWRDQDVDSSCSCHGCISFVYRNQPPGLLDPPLVTCDEDES